MPLDALQLMQGYRARDLANMGAQQRMDIVPQQLALQQQAAQQAQQRQKALADLQGQQIMQKVQQGRQLAAYQAATLASHDMDRAQRGKIEDAKLKAQAGVGIHPVTIADESSPTGAVVIDARTGKRLGDRPPQPIKADVNIAGGRESVFLNRVILSGNEAARDLENVVKLPMSANRGMFGGRGQSHGLFNAAQETLANKMTTQEVQSYNVLATGFQRSLAAIEAAGLAPAGQLSKQMDAVIFKEGDTNFTKMQKLAQTRQIVEAGLETTAENPRVPQQTRDHIKKIMDRVEKAVPFTHEDIFRLQELHQTNPNATLQDAINMRGKAQTGGTQEGAEQVSKSGKPMIYRNGQWEYK